MLVRGRSPVQYQTGRTGWPGEIGGGMAEYDAEQLGAGFRAMTMLAGLVRRGGRPAAVAPTIPLRAGEKQFGWFPVTVDGGERRIAVVTSLRLIAGEEFPLRTISRVRPVPGEWSVMLAVLGRAESIVLSGPWELEPSVGGVPGWEWAMSGVPGWEPAVGGVPGWEPAVTGVPGREPAAAMSSLDLGGMPESNVAGPPKPGLGGVPRPRRRPGVVTACPGRRGD